MGKLKDISGQRFGYLTAIKIHHKIKTSTRTTYFWLCKCDCGNYSIVPAGNLKSGHTKSCGCLKHKPSRITHNLSKTRLYNIYNGMKSRCQNTNNPRYKDYGERGIKICPEWLENFMNFYNWAINNGYSDHLTIDRIDNNGDYEPKNCRWVDYIRQNNNRRNSHIIKYNGISHTLAEWAKIYNLDASLILYRLNRGWSIEKAFTTNPEIYKNR